jgi:hypothetical protein
MKLYFDHEHYEYLTESELLASYHQLRRENHTETEDYFDYVRDATSKNGTLQKMSDTHIIDRLHEMCTRHQTLTRDRFIGDAERQLAAIVDLCDAITRAERE